ncbi:MAG: Zn(II)2Cys6 transcription factor domain-containing protein, partial [Rhodoferax sp.]|nr:Zn(II)2Cys6 transcription factor domain-containing protein [Rhodoferax sp.]
MADPSPHAFAMPSGPPHNPESASVSIRDRAARARAQEKARRKNAPRACVICAARKVSCDAGRPCIRCVKAGKEDQCVDVITKRRRKVVHDGEGESEEDYDDYAPSVVTRASARQHAAVLGACPFPLLLAFGARARVSP